MFGHLVKFWEVGWAENFSASPDDKLKRTGEYKKKCIKIKNTWFIIAWSSNIDEFILPEKTGYLANKFYLQRYQMLINSLLSTYDVLTSTNI